LHIFLSLAKIPALKHNKSRPFNERGAILQNRKRFQVDSEHIGIRIVMPLLIFGGCIISFVLTRGLLDALSIDELLKAVIIITVVTLSVLGIAWLSDKYLKRIWPSGREVILEDNRLRMVKKENVNASLRLDEPINFLLWYFTVRKKAYIPKGWHCLAVRMLQDDETAIVYAFFPPDEAEDWPFFGLFTELLPKGDKEDEKRAESHRLLLGEKSRYRVAERERWENGAEMKREDFCEFVADLSENAVGWPQS
jgi:hypothetical protein